MLLITNPERNSYQTSASMVFFSFLVKKLVITPHSAKVSIYAPVHKSKVSDYSAAAVKWRAFLKLSVRCGQDRKRELCPNLSRMSPSKDQLGNLAHVTADFFGE